MAFHNIRLTEDLSYGYRAAVSFRTSIQQLDAGHEERVGRWNVERRKFFADKQDFHHTDIHDLYKFYLARKGALNGFRLKDWAEYATTPTGTTHLPGDAAVTHLDMKLGTGDGTTTQFQLQTQYPSGGQQHNRAITLPVNGTVKVGIDGIDQGGGFSVNLTTGVVTFSTAPTAATVLTWGGEFDVPVRFDNVDRGLERRIDFHDLEAVLDIPLVEILDDTSVPETHDAGGSLVDLSWSADISLSAHTRLVQLGPTTSGLSVYLPVPANLDSGGPYFFVINDSGTNTFTIRDDAGTALDTVPVSDDRTILLLDNGDGTKSWVSIS